MNLSGNLNVGDKLESFGTFTILNWIKNSFYLIKKWFNSGGWLHVLPENSWHSTTIFLNQILWSTKNVSGFVLQKGNYFCTENLLLIVKSYGHFPFLYYGIVKRRCFLSSLRNSCWPVLGIPDLQLETRCTTYEH